MRSCSTWVWDLMIYSFFLSLMGVLWFLNTRVLEYWLERSCRSLCPRRSKQLILRTRTKRITSVPRPHKPTTYGVSFLCSVLFQLLQLSTSACRCRRRLGTQPWSPRTTSRLLRMWAKCCSLTFPMSLNLPLSPQAKLVSELSNPASFL